VVHVNKGVPKSVEFINIIVIFQREIVTTLVSYWEFLVKSGEAMQWLMDISHEMNE